jgi:hypothetical protein
MMRKKARMTKNKRHSSLAHVHTTSFAGKSIITPIPNHWLAGLCHGPENRTTSDIFRLYSNIIRTSPSPLP